MLVNDRKVNRPSYRVARGNRIAIRPGSRALAEQALASGAGLESPWLAIDRDALTITIASFPDESFLPFDLQVRLIVEHYSRAM